MAILYLLLLLSLLESIQCTATSQQQRIIRNHCNNICECYFRDGLSVRCTGFKDLKQLSLKIQETDLIDTTSSGSSENVEPTPYFDKTNIVIAGTDRNVKTVFAAEECPDTDDTEVCFKKGSHPLLAHATTFQLFHSCCRDLKEFGKYNNSFLSIFTSIKELVVAPETDRLNIYASEIPTLEILDLALITSRETSLYCMTKDGTCLTNPNGMKDLRIIFAGQLLNSVWFHGSFIMPRHIETLELKKSQDKRETITTSEGNSRNIEPLFQDVKIDILTLSIEVEQLFDHITWPLVGLLKVSGSDSQALESKLKVCYKHGVQSSMKLEFPRLPSSYRFPYAYLEDKEFDTSAFKHCPLANKIFNVYGEVLEKDDTVLVVRGFHLKLSEIKTMADKHRSLREVEAHAYYMDLDSDITDIANKVRLYAIDARVPIDSGSQTPRFLKLNEVASRRILALQGDEKKYINFPYQFINMTQTSYADSIFMAAITTCVISNIADYQKEFPGKLATKDRVLKRWYDFVVSKHKYSDNYSNGEKARAHLSFKYLQDYVTLLENQNREVAKVPLLTLETITENAYILTQAGRDLQDKQRHAETLADLQEIREMGQEQLKTVLTAIDNAKITLLKTSKTKSQTLANIEKRKQDDMEKAINESDAFINELTVEFDKYTDLVKKETANFKRGAQLAMSLAIAEAAAEAVGAIMSIFSGGFNPADMLRAARETGETLMRLENVLRKLVKIMKSIGKLISQGKLMKSMFEKVKLGWKTMKTRIPDFFRRQKESLIRFMDRELDDPALVKRAKEYTDKIGEGLESLSEAKDIVDTSVNFIKARRTVTAGFDPGNPLASISDSPQNVASEEEAIKQFKSRHAKDMVSEGNSMNPIDVYKWDIAREHVVGAVDTTLSDDVPEATNYRAALLKLIRTGHTRTQAEVDRASKQGMFAASKDIWELYIAEATGTGIKIFEIEEEMKKRESGSATANVLRSSIRKEKEKTELEFQLEAFAIKMELVRLNEEFCNAYFYFHLEKCPENLKLYPSDDLHKVIKIQNMLIYQSKQKLADINPPPQTFTDRTITIKALRYCSCLNNLRTFSSDLRDQRRSDAIFDAYHISDACLRNHGVEIDRTDHSTFKSGMRRIIKKCTEDETEAFKSTGIFSYNVSIDYSVFSRDERVRVDNIKAIFKGIKTNNGVVKSFVESTGTSEDRYHGKCFRFIGEKLIRKFSYFSKNAIVSKRSELARVEATLNTVLHKQNELKELIKGEQIEFIDSTKVHESFAGIYQNPTVFTIFTFNVSEVENPGLDLSGLEEIELKFSGSFVTSGPERVNYQCSLPDVKLEEEESTGGNANSDDAPPNHKKPATVKARAQAKKKSKKKKKRKEKKN